MKAHKTQPLTLGWKLTADNYPKYWLDPHAKPGKQKTTDLVTVDPESIAAHTLIIAQSGSGKSFFVGRLLEEFLINTRIRCIILDPNGDFTKPSNVADKSLWTRAGYGPHAVERKFPTESSRTAFLDRWEHVDKCVFSAASGPSLQSYKVWLPDIESCLLTCDHPSEFASQLELCHSITSALLTLCEFLNPPPVNSLALAQDLLVRIAQSPSRLHDIVHSTLPLSAEHDEFVKHAFLIINRSIPYISSPAAKQYSPESRCFRTMVSTSPTPAPALHMDSASKFLTWHLGATPASLVSLSMHS